MYGLPALPLTAPDSAPCRGVALNKDFQYPVCIITVRLMYNAAKAGREAGCKSALWQPTIIAKLYSFRLAILVIKS